MATGVGTGVGINVAVDVGADVAVGATVSSGESQAKIARVKATAKITEISVRIIADALWIYSGVEARQWV